MMRRAAAGLVCVVAFAASAHADGMYSRSYAAPFSWTGLYVGVQGGWSRLDDTQALSSPTFALTVPNTPQGYLLGGHVGYNSQYGHTVVGIEVDLEYNSTDSTYTIGAPFVNTTGNEKLMWQGSFRSRLGWAFDRALLYGTSGVAFGGFRDRFDTVSATFHETVDSTRIGWTLGGGLEYAVTNQLSAKVEYRYTDWFTNKDTLNVFLAPPGRSNDEVTQQTVRLGISYKFTRDHERVPLK
jgi:outer membrane immunogenic protein